MKSILVLHGPNLNLLGLREPEVYGNDSLRSIHEELSEFFTAHSVQVEFFQSNHEGNLIDKIQESILNTEIVRHGILINPGGFTHTSVALRDALLAVRVPFVEVHMSNIYAREPFRHHSYLSDIAIGQVVGFGKHSYLLGADALIRYILSNHS